MTSLSLPILLFSLILSQCCMLTAAFDHTHKDWDTVLKSHVRDALVDYDSLSKDSRLLKRYLEQLNSVSRAEVDAWPRNHQLAFWINAYNAFTVQAILDHYPIRTWTVKGLVVPRNSIIQIPGVWKKLEWEVAGQSLTIDTIEHGLLRPKFKEPRMHFAVVCASIGCPNLRPEAFIFDKLEAQLEDQTLSYLSSAKGVTLDFEKNRVFVSQLFKWYTEDFVQDPPIGFRIGKRSEKERIAFQFISHYLTEPRAWELLQSPDTEFDFLSYDWSLNELAAKDD